MTCNFVYRHFDVSQEPAVSIPRLKIEAVISSKTLTNICQTAVRPFQETAISILEAVGASNHAEFGSVYSIVCLGTQISHILKYLKGQSSWLQIRRPGFDSRHYQKRKVVGLERGPLSFVSTTEELLDRKVAAPVY
jgi:hypothetical protein